MDSVDFLFESECALQRPVLFLLLGVGFLSAHRVFVGDLCVLLHLVLSLSQDCHEFPSNRISVVHASASYHVCPVLLLLLTQCIALATLPFFTCCVLPSLFLSLLFQHFLRMLHQCRKRVAECGILLLESLLSTEEAPL